MSDGLDQPARRRWIEDIVDAIRNLGGVAHRADLIDEVRRLRSPPHPATIDKIIQKEIQTHSSDSDVFRGGTANDLFFSAEGIGQGVWGLRAWLGPTPHATDLDGNDLPQRVLVDTYRILRDTDLARRIKLLHGNRCQVCGEVLQLEPSVTYSEAHHIRALGSPHFGPDTGANIIVVCPNHHALLDFGAIPLDLAQIRTAAGHTIGQEFIDYHNSVVCRSHRAP